MSRIIRVDEQIYAIIKERRHNWESVNQTLKRLLGETDAKEKSEAQED